MIKIRKPKVSLVIATYNEEKNIATLLESCANQIYENLELIVVDSQKTSDSTRTIAKKHTPFVYRFGKERSPQRNYGVEKSKGKYVLILDADMKLDLNVVASCVNEIESNEKLGAVIIPEKSYGNTFWAKCKALERKFYIGDENIEAARFYLKEAFSETGGFNEKMIAGEDWDLNKRIKKIGWEIGRINEFIHHNEGDLNLVKTLKKKFYYSIKSTNYIESNISGIKDIVLFLFRPSYFRNWKYLFFDPTHFIGFLFMKFSEFFVGSLAIIVKPSFWKKVFERI